MARRGAVGLVVLGVLLLAGVAGRALLGGDAGRPAPPPPASTRAAPPTPRTLAALRPDRVIRRVEALRGLRLKRRPRFRVVSAAQAQRQLTRDGGAGDQGDAGATAVDTALQTLLGLLPPGADVDEIARRIAGDAFLGFYDGARNEMTIVGRDGRLPAGAEATVAHELVHAIDEQHFGIFRRLRRTRDDDARLAYTAVVEGSATDVGDRYAARYHVPQEDPGDARRARALVRDVPFGLLLQLSFPYAVGEEFVRAVRRDGGEAAVARALTTEAPRATVGILDPAWWRAGRRPAPVRLDARRVLGRGWRQLDADAIGAADVLALLAPTEADASTAAVPAQGWRGGRYVFLRRGGGRVADCRAPCVRRDAVVGAVRFDTAARAQAFTRLLGRTLTARRGAKAAGDGLWVVRGAGAAVGTRGAVATFAYAPTPALAARLVRDAPSG
ncbi:hypothetical protein [Patulibacter sp. SYSU D01012]|uniref:hypothetical protein n=1 Tax=Patulibacter sp. SYSU D01012 TaxID=2817381 RepID=UPI001B309422|nr:hypothetical protein [Patulibacter sp. SYSU D01012]